MFLKIPILALSVLALSLPLVARNVNAAVESSFDLDAAAVRSQCDFRSDMRKLWEDHVTWTRLYIVSELSNVPDKAATTQRLLRNQTDIGNAVAVYYGRPAGLKLRQLLREHILTAANVVTAAKLRDNRRLRQANQAWVANADEIALFLSTANPDNWGLADMKAMMHDHLQLTTKEVVTYLHGDYAASIAAYDQVHVQALHMADMLSSGIIRQFPRRFN